MKLPRAIDYHKLDKREVPNGFGVIYTLVSVTSLYTLYYLGVETALALASCILVGGFLGLMDDWIDIPWRYKAFLPLIASIPLITLRQGVTTMATYLWGKIDFGVLYYLVIIPIIVMVVTNSINMLGGLNGLETIPPLIILGGLALSSNQGYLLLIPILSLSLLAIGNFKGKFFVGNVGSFSIGLTIASFGIVTNIEQIMVFSLTPYIFNSVLILFSYFFLHEKASLVLLNNGKLTAHKRRSLLTILAHGSELSEKKIVCLVCCLVFLATYFAYWMG